MKANKGQIERALDAPPADIRLFLLHGPDEAGSRALAERIERAMGPEAERIDLDSAALKGDPARLADEAASISLFGGARHIRVAIANADDCVPAVDALLTAAVAGNPVVAIAGALKGTSALLKRALAEPAIMAFASYAPEGQDADRLAQAMALAEHLREIFAQMQINAAGNPVMFTCSFGVSEWETGDSLDGLLKRADIALYRAKTSGRNRVMKSETEWEDDDEPRSSGIIRFATR